MEEVEISVNKDFSFAEESVVPSNLQIEKGNTHSLDEIIARKRVALDLVDSCDEEEKLASSKPSKSQKNHKQTKFQAVESESEADSSESDSEIEDSVAEEERKKKYFKEGDTSQSFATFAEMGLSRTVLKGLSSLNWTAPTKIQSVAIPVALQGKDICGGAVTGSGKTAAFSVPIIERLLYRPKDSQVVRVLVILPTRELAVQCHEVITNIAQYTDIKVCLLAGGLPMKKQELELRKRPDIVVATPGRLIDHIHNSPTFTLDHIEILVLDEADRMLEDGFEDELNEIIKFSPKNRQTMLFSATMTDNVSDLIRLSLVHPVRLFVDSNQAVADNLIQEFIRIREVRETDRLPIILALCKRTFKAKTIIFFPSKLLAHRAKIIFGLLGLNAGELHGNLTQAQRLEALEKFKSNQYDYLLATDLAARGIDISGIEVVINYSMPSDFKQYQHRIGRTARAGKSGRSVTLAGEADRKILKLAVKNSTGSVCQRNIQPDIIVHYKQRISNLEIQIQEIVDEEHNDRLLEKADMEIKKAENVMNHRQEIYSRPKKVWFQSEKEKKEKLKQKKKDFKSKK